MLPLRLNQARELLHTAAKPAKEDDCGTHTMLSYDQVVNKVKILVEEIFSYFYPS